MALIIKNISTKTLLHNDLGDGLKYGIDGLMSQSHTLVPNETITLAITDEVKNSLLTGDLKKHSDLGYISILGGTVYTLNQVTEVGVAAAAKLSLLDVISVESILAYVIATGAPAVKTLLELTTDYTVANGEITMVTDQSANNLVVSYRAV